MFVEHDAMVVQRFSRLGFRAARRPDVAGVRSPGPPGVRI